MSLSTNSVIHYTDSLSNIKGILKNGFRIKYCLETFISKESYFSGAFAMVSFCDIPLSETKNHIKSYGGYGIGLSKEWATENGMNPVLYIDKDSIVGEISATFSLDPCKNRPSAVLTSLLVSIFRLYSCGCMLNLPKDRVQYLLATM